MEQSNFPENKPKRKWLYILLFVAVGLLVFLFFQEKKIKKQQAIKMQFIEEKNALRDDLDDLILPGVDELIIEAIPNSTYPI